VKIFVFSDGVRHGCYVYREEIPLEALERRGHVVAGGLLTNPVDGIESDVSDSDLFIMPRFLFGDYPLVVDEIQRNGRPLVYEIDDAADLFERHQTSYFQVCNSLPSYYYMIQQADLVTTTTEHLAQHLRSLGAKRVEVLPNCPPPGLTWADPPQNATVRIGYTGWTAHILDAAFWMEVIAALYQQRQDFIPVLFGIANTSDADGEAWMEKCRMAVNQNPLPNADFGAALQIFRRAWKPVKDILEWRHMVPIDDYWDTLADLKLDIGCAPLLDTPFNRCKSCVKFYDFATAGALTIASDVLPYSQEPMIQVPNTVGEWVRMLSLFIDSHEQRLDRLEEQRAWILTNRHADTWAVAREGIYRSLMPSVEAVA
jgi:hypothetical protein